MKECRPRAFAEYRLARIGAICVCALTLSDRAISAASGTIDVDLTFDPSGLRFLPSGDHDIPTLQGCDATWVPGEPQLPAYNAHVVLPPGARVERVDVTWMQTIPLPGERVIQTVQPPTIFSRRDPDGRRRPLLAPKRSPYAFDAPYPSAVVQHAGTGRFGAYTIAGLTAYPLSYVPAEKRCLFHPAIRFRLTYTVDSLSSRAALRPSPPTSERHRDAIRKLVCNPEHIEAFSPPTSHPLKRLTNDSVGRDAYVIITDPAFVSAFEPLADWKTKKGVPARIVTTSWIYSSYEGIDSQEKIRAFLRDAFESRGTIWALLGGDTPWVPVRKAYALDCKAGFDADENDIPCDLYYSDLDGTWNAGGRPDVFGEVADQVDLMPDVFVGRAPASTVQQAETFVRKVLAYEKSPPPDYLTTMLFAAEVLWSNPYTDQGIAKDRIGESFVPPRFDIDKLYQRDGNESPATVLAAMDQGKHIINHDGHAWIDVLSVGSGLIHRAGIEGLANAEEYSILYSIGCWSTAFDRDSIAERFVNDPDGGGVAVIGNSRYGWGALGEPGFGYSDRFDRAFYELLFDRGVYPIGANLALSKAAYVPFSREENVYRWCQYELNLIGDPEMPIWTDRPARLTVSHPSSVPVGPSSFAVTVRDGAAALPAAVVCVRKDGEVYAAAPTDGSGRVVFAIEPVSPTGDLEVTVTAHDYLPYEGTVDVVSEAAHVGVSGYAIDDGPGNGDGQLSPGESVRLAVELENYGGLDVAGVTATLAAVSPDVVVADAASTYGDIAAGQRVSADDTFAVSLGTARGNGETIFLTLAIADAEQNRWESTLALRVATPVLACDLLGLEEVPAGSGDGLLEPGETVRMYVRVENRGLAAADDVSASLAADDAFLDIPAGARDFGTLPPGSRAGASFDVTIAEACPTPRFPAVSTNLTADGGYRFSGTIPLTVGRAGFLDDVESDAAGWSYPDGTSLWHRTSHRAHGGSFSWYCGLEAQRSYPNGVSSVLLGPPIVLGREPTLSFWTWYDLPLYGTTGLYVEVTSGAGWETLDFIGSGGALHPLLMGQDWVRNVYDLSRFAPGTAVQLRFRFVSDSEAAREGVYVDDISVGAVHEGSEGAAFVRGDADADGSVTVTDPIVILSYLFLRGDEPGCLDAADSNDDGAVDVSDAVRTLLHLFGGMTLDPPLGACRPDATADALDCLAAPPCG